jgi:hypothetical protein
MAGPTKKEAAMLLRKLVLAAAALIVSAPVLADPHWRDRDEWRERRFEHHYYPRYYYYPQYYRPAPRVVVVERPAYPAGVGIVLGAIAGAVIAHELSR